MSSRYYYVYTLSNFSRTALYTGITGNLVKRVYEHKNNLVDGFGKSYYVHDLLYYEVFEDPTSAIEREKQIKSWSRKKKDELIAKFNPTLEDCRVARRLAPRNDSEIRVNVLCPSRFKLYPSPPAGGSG